MNQQQNNRTVGLVLGMLLLIASLGCDWLTIPHAKFPGGRSFPFDMSVTITGRNGFITLLGIHMPIWLVVTLGLLALGLMALNDRGITALPRAAIGVPAVVCLGYAAAVVALSVINHSATLHIGPFLAGAGVLVGLLSTRRSVAPVR